MNPNLRHSNIWLWLTAPIAILLGIAAGSGVFVGDLYRDNPFFTAQARGQDFVSLGVVLPVLIITSVLASRGSPRARVIWLGTLIYLIYSYFIATFDVRFNSLFLVYVALLGCSLYALIGGLATTDLNGIKTCFTPTTPVKIVSIYLAVLAILFYFLWLSEIVPALLVGKIPQSILDNGTPTNAVHVLDMAWILPAFGITAVSLQRRQALGYTLAGALLTYAILLILAILGMVAAMVQRGQPVVIQQVIIFGVILTMNIGMLIWYMRNMIIAPPSDQLLSVKMENSN